MSDEPKSFFLAPHLHQYVVQHGTPPDPVQQELIEETRKLGGLSVMQIAPEQGAFMTILTRALRVRRAVEVGTFTGYSALCIARGLSEGGKLLTCDVNEEWTGIARRYWEKAGVAHKIEQRLGPAAETLRELPHGEVFELAFLDADKAGYRTYYEEILQRLKPNGLILVDNVLWFGRVADPAADDENTRHIRAFNEYVARDGRVECAMLAISDGLSVIRKR